jgi:farnesyl-diphosphate farnesyltransferase
LSIRLLPGRLRQPIGLAYLLARASDTIADSAKTTAAARRDHLAAFAAAIQNGGSDGIRVIQQAIRSDDPAENNLIARLDESLLALASVDEADRALIRAVLARIIHGQDLDLVRFGDDTQLTALSTPAELEEYTYLVAGCVGEFWTDVCRHHYPRFSQLEIEPLRTLARDYGKALQFVNILRDLPADLRNHRCYLPSSEVDPQSLVSNPQVAREVFARWLHRATDLLDSGRRYTAAIRLPRLRAACFLPWDIGRQTLQLLSIQSPLETDARIKIPRSAVRSSLLRAAFAAFSNAPLSAKQQ